MRGLVDNFRFQPACFVGNPTHHIAALPVIAQFDATHLKRFHGKPYAPDCMNDPEWAQSNVYFTVALSNGVHQVKVFSNN